MKNAKIIQINGISGIIKAIFVGVCLLAGFVVFPGFVAMYLWNNLLTDFVPAVNIMQGVLLWIMTVIVYFILTKRGFSIKFASPDELDEEEMNLLMKKVELQSQARKINDMVLKSLEEIEKSAENQPDNNFDDKNKE